jgi:hypothetical protein
MKSSILVTYLKFINFIALNPNQSINYMPQNTAESFSKSAQSNPQTKNLTFNYTPRIPKTENYGSSIKYESPGSTLGRLDKVLDFTPTPVTPELRQNNFAYPLPPIKKLKKSKSRSLKRKSTSRSKPSKASNIEITENSYSKWPSIPGNLMQPNSYQDNIWRDD